MESMFWLILFIVFLVFEIATLGLTTIWFAGGAIIAFILALADIHIGIQIVVFFAVSFLLLFFTRPLAQKYINRNTVKTNVDELVGKVVKCTETIDNYNEMGSVRINGNDWMARTIADGMTIPKDTLVQIVEIQGVKALVQPINYTHN
ncbi:MAG: NfeD family protein [Lachnospiraceae bacterium]